MNEKQVIFLIGAKSLGQYGGYETFIDKLTEYHQNDAEIQYYVACKANGEGSMNPETNKNAEIINSKRFIYHNSFCYRVTVPDFLGPAKAVYYDLASIKECIKIIKEEKIQHPIIYIMACRIGPFIKHYYKKLHKLGAKLYINPDGHEWMRAKWNTLIKKYWKISEKLMVKYSDLIICDSINIENYIHSSYDNEFKNNLKPKTTYIAYGAEIRKSELEDNNKLLIDWCKKNNIEKYNYYLIVGRFVPENNYETMIREFMKSQTKKDLVIITNHKNKFFDELENKLNFSSDSRIKFVGTVYDKELLMKIRENAYAYIHGHEVGGTNPSLLEALSSTRLNLLLNVGFNREVGEASALYWSKDENNLKRLIEEVDCFDAERLNEFDEKSLNVIKKRYNWPFICKEYKKCFLDKEGINS